MSTATLPLAAFTDVLPRYSREMREEITAATAQRGDTYTDVIEPGTVRRTRGIRLSPYSAGPNAPHQGIMLDLVVVTVYTGTRTGDNVAPDGESYNTPGNEAWNAHRYAVTVAHPESGETIQSAYAEGTAHRPGFPDAADVLAGLLTDASSVLPYLVWEDAREPGVKRSQYRAAYDGAWREWAGDLGYPEDSHTARQAFRACAKTATRLRAMLGDTFERAVEIAGAM